MHRASFVALLFVSLVGSPLAAQGRSFDVTVGVGTGWGGRYKDPEAAHIELTYVPAHATPVITAFTFGARATPSSNDRCLLDPTRTTCLEEFPPIAHVGWLRGVEAGPPLATVRATAGPALYVGNGFAGAGGQLHIDGAVGVSRVALVAAARGGFVARTRGSPLRIGSLEVGIRFR